MFNDGSDRRERDEQVRALSDTISAYSAKVGRAMHEAARDAARERSAKDAIAQIQPRIQQANRQLGDLKTLLVELHKADDEVLEMGQAFVALEDKFAQLTVWVRDDPAAVRAAVDRVRSTIKAKAEAFARGAAIACSSVDLSR